MAASEARSRDSKNRGDQRARVARMPARMGRGGIAERRVDPEMTGTEVRSKARTEEALRCASRITLREKAGLISKTA